MDTLIALLATGIVMNAIVIAVIAVYASYEFIIAIDSSSSPMHHWLVKSL